MDGVTDVISAGVICGGIIVASTKIFDTCLLLLKMSMQKSAAERLIWDLIVAFSKKYFKRSSSSNIS